jgi:flagellar motor switch protein FliG
MSDPSSRVLSGPEKAAVLLLALGSEVSARLISGLTLTEIELLANQVARTQQVDDDIRGRVVEEFEQAAATDLPAEGGVAFARDLLIQALGEEKAAGVISRLESASGGAGFSIEGEKEAVRLGRLLQGQHPQIGAAALGQFPPDLAARVLGALPKEMQLEVVLRLLEMDDPDAGAFRRLGQALRTGLRSDQPSLAGSTDAARRLAEILNSADWETEQGVLHALNEYDPKLGKQVRDRMFVFDDLVDLEPRDLQLVLRKVSQEDLRLALSAAGDKLKELILTNMSERAAAALKEDMEAGGAIKPKQARAAQQRIAAAARQLAHEGTLNLEPTAEEEAETVPDEEKTRTDRAREQEERPADMPRGDEHDSET